MARKKQKQRHRHRHGLLHRLIVRPVAALARHSRRHLPAGLSRRARRFLLGLPALIAGITFPVLLIAEGIQRRELIETYQLAGRAALRSDDMQAANTYYRRLAGLQLDSLEAAYGLARTRLAQGPDELAEKTMVQLAPQTHVGYPAAHLYVAKKMVQEQQGAPFAVPEARLLVHHLESALRSTPPPAEAYRMLGQTYLSLEQPDLAARQFEKCTGEFPEVHLLLAEIYKQTKNNSFKEHCRQGIQYFSARTRSDSDDIASRIAWARCLQLDDEFDDARETLSEAPGGLHGPLRDAMASLYISQSDLIQDKNDPRPRERLQYLSDSLKFAPENPQVFVRLVALLGTGGEIQDEAKKKLEDIVESGHATATVYMALGTLAANEADHARRTDSPAMESKHRELAESYYEQALQLSPDLPVMLNNFAWVLLRANPPKLNRALDLANRAVELRPADPRMRDTRGQILAQLGRWEDALIDLELALESMSGNEHLHLALAGCYAELGDTQLEDLHRAAAEQVSDTPTAE